MSLAFLTKLNAIMSAPSFRAQRRSSSSFLLSAGTSTATPGRFMPLLFDTGPPMTTSVVTVVASTAVARSDSRPSSISSMSPTDTSFGRPL